MPSLPVKMSVDNTLGAVLVGFAVSCCVYGILITQVYVYFSRYPSDRHAYKYLVSSSDAVCDHDIHYLPGRLAYVSITT